MAETEGLDDSILNMDDGTEPPQSMDFDENQIAELLGEKEDPPESAEKALGEENSEAVEPEEPEVEKQAEDVVVQIDEDVVQLEFDEEMIEEVILADSPVPDENEPVENGKRKHEDLMTTPPKSPARKRQRRRVSTYFAIRQNVIDKITTFMTSYDSCLNLKEFELSNLILRDQVLGNNAIYEKNMDALRQENEKLRMQLSDEKQAHALTIKKLEQLETEMIGVAKNMKKLSNMMTLQVSPEFDDTEYGRWLRQKEASPQATQPPHRRHIPQYQPIYSKKVAIVARAPNQIIVQPRVPPLYQQLQKQQQQQKVPAETVRVLPLPPPPATQQRRSGPGWPVIPIPTKTNLGHCHEGNSNTGVLKDLIDSTENSGRITLGIPYISPGNVIPISETVLSKPPSLPKVFEAMEPDSDVTVVINSSSQDFRENWQIGGKINYDRLSGIENKVVQMFVQVGSLRACGMGGRVGTMRRTCDWGISKEWPCGKKSHKFRIMFHRNQMLPRNDRVTVMVAIRDTHTGDVVISSPSYLNLA